MPRLADHAEDIPLLVVHFAAQLPGDPFSLDAGALLLLMAQPWLGNVRELKNFVERAQAHFAGQPVTAELAARLLQRGAATPRGRAPPPPLQSAPPPPLPLVSSDTIDLKAVLATVEEAYILEALAASGGAIAASAKRLGLQRTTLIEKMRRLQISPERPA